MDSASHTNQMDSQYHATQMEKIEEMILKITRCLSK